MRLLLRHPNSDAVFRTRGAEVSRIEGFSDTVFGFAMTLLVISVNAPATAAALMETLHGVVPFVASFMVLFAIWRSQFDFFRRYGLEDGQTIRLTAILMMIVLLAIYPLKFLCTIAFDVVPRALLAHNDSMKLVARANDMPRVGLLFTMGFFGVNFVFSRLYRHAGSQHQVLALSEAERFETRKLELHWRGRTFIGLAAAAGCITMMAATTFGGGDNARGAGYLVFGGLVCGTSMYQRRVMNRFSEQQPARVAEPAAIATLA